MAAQKCAKALRATCHEGSYSYGLRKARLLLLRQREQLLGDLRVAESGSCSKVAHLLSQNRTGRRGTVTV
jgi:hypothetical protein